MTNHLSSVPNIQQHMPTGRNPNAACFVLQFIASVDFDCIQSCVAQSAFDRFYNLVISLLDAIYPDRRIVVTSRDPVFVTADIKAKFR
jgi:hypothetical protein